MQETICLDWECSKVRGSDGSICLPMRGLLQTELNNQQTAISSGVNTNCILLQYVEDKDSLRNGFEKNTLSLCYCRHIFQYSIFSNVDYHPCFYLTRQVS